MQNTQEIKIGKTVIETLTQGMYEDSRYIFREYIQNSADQIDKAITLGLLNCKKDGKINILIDKDKKEISIEDNATGIKNTELFSTLGNIALSEKDRNKDKGFRGIGRLGGLGYCKELIFISKFKGEDFGNRMSWDAQKLQDKLFDLEITEDASQIVKSVINITRFKEDTDKHYFKVILSEVKNEKLLDVNSIREYLSMVAPIPYQSHFYFKELIYKKAIKLNLTIDEYYIYINTEQLFKPYTTIIYESSSNNIKKSIDEIFDVIFVDFYNENDIIAWMWYGISKFEKQIASNPNFYRGLRLRKNNIQIGNEQTLVNKKLHREDRGNHYFIGEIFCIHKDLIPNSRRDYFNDSQILTKLEEELKHYFHTILYVLYHRANEIKNAVKKIDSYQNFLHEYNQAEKKGFISGQLEEFINKKEIGKTKANEGILTIKKIANQISETEDEKNIILSKVKNKILADTNIDKIDSNLNNGELPEQNKPQPRRTDKLSSLSNKDRKFLDKIFKIINNTLNKDLAEELIQKIEEDLK